MKVHIGYVAEDKNCKKYEIHIKQLNIMFRGKSMEQTIKIGVFPNFEGVKDEDVFFSDVN